MEVQVLFRAQNKNVWPPGRTFLFLIERRGLNGEGVGEREFPVEEGMGKPWVSQGSSPLPRTLTLWVFRCII